MRRLRAPLPHLLVRETSVHAETRRNGTASWAGEAVYASLEELAEVIARLGAAPPERCRKLHVVLDRPPVQTRVLTDLPPVGERELAALVANQAGRFFRRNGAPLVTDAAWVSTPTGKVTHAAAVAEPLVLAICAGASQAGLFVECITAAATSPGLELLPHAERARRRRTRRRSLIQLSVAALAVWILAGLLFGVRLHVERKRVDAELAAADAPLAALREVRAEMRSAEAMVRQLADARRARGEALAALARVNAALPDSALLTSYAWRSDGSGILTGSARTATTVLAALERNRAVSSPRIDGAIVREATSGGREWERFTILFGESRP